MYRNLPASSTPSRERQPINTKSSYTVLPIRIPSLPMRIQMFLHLYSRSMTISNFLLLSPTRHNKHIFYAVELNYATYTSDVPPTDIPNLLIAEYNNLILSFTEHSSPTRHRGRPRQEKEPMEPQTRPSSQPPPFLER